MNIRSKGLVCLGIATIGAAAWRALDAPLPQPATPHRILAGKRPGADRPATFIHPEPASMDVLLENRAQRDNASPALPAAAAEEALSIKTPALREEMMRRAMQAWAATDPAAALAWAARLPDPAEAGMAMLHVCLQVSENDPAAAITRASQYHLDESPGDLVGNLAAGWAARDLTAAQDWVNQQPAGELRDGLMERIVFARAQSDPAAAARMVVDGMGPGDHQIEAAISVLHQWLLQDAGAARAWVALFPEGSLRDRATGELAGMQFDLPK